MLIEDIKTELKAIATEAARSKIYGGERFQADQHILNSLKLSKEAVTSRRGRHLNIISLGKRTTYKKENDDLRKKMKDSNRSFKTMERAASRQIASRGSNLLFKDLRRPRGMAAARTVKSSRTTEVTKAKISGPLIRPF